MLDIKRTIDEVIAIYAYEEDIVDVYIEGITDKYIIDNYFEYVGCNKSVIEINDIDFSEVQKDYSDLDLKSNKNKLIALSWILTKNNIDSRIKCVVDRDFDGILTPIQEDSHILYTDFSCMESYLCCCKHLGKILKIGIGNFPHNTELVIQEVSKIVLILFVIRIINENFRFGIQSPKIENHMSVNKKNGICGLDFVEYVEKYINTNRLSKQKDEILNFANDIKKSLPIDNRFNMNGHDFIEVLFHYINKIKNTVNFRFESFEKAVYLSIQPNYLTDYELFKKLKQ